MSIIKLAICDDHPVFVNGLISTLSHEASMEIVGTGNRAVDMMTLLYSNPYDVVLLDVEMPEMDGVSLTRWLKEQDLQVAVVALTMFDSAEKINEMVQAGADGYLIKTAGVNDIVQAVKTVHAGEKYFKGPVLNKILSISNEGSNPDPMGLLTKRECEILRYFAREQSASEISQTLSISIHTVNSHKKNILKKLNLKNTASLIVFAYKNQLI